MNQRDIDILKKIIKYCDEIAVANADFGNTIDALKTKTSYKNAVAMCILQIGELTTHLTEEFRLSYSQVPWKHIKNMRNLAAHRYGEFDLDILWETVTDSIPELRDYCIFAIQEMETL